MSKKNEMREVACLLVSRGGEVLLMTKDGEHWTLPQEEVRRDENGALIESSQDAIQRLYKKFDPLSEEEDSYREIIPTETKRRHRSHSGVETNYRVYPASAENFVVAELLLNGARCEWVDNPFSGKYKLNECAKEILREYGL
ncbi:MAG: hypothetical protein Q8R25_01460 [bacterium]|nr:hypothetical protein [bacterium]